jgi:hypothetical protein
MLRQEIERVLQAELTDRDLAAIETGANITIPLRAEAVKPYMTDNLERSLATLSKVVTEVGAVWDLDLRIHYYFLPYDYVYLLIVSGVPGDDDGDFLELTDPAATPSQPVEPSAQTKPLAMRAAAGGR